MEFMQEMLVDFDSYSYLLDEADDKISAHLEDEIIDFILYLSKSDGKVTITELNFFNTLFNLEVTLNDLNKRIKERKLKRFDYAYSQASFVANFFFSKCKENKISASEAIGSLKELIAIYRYVGTSFIACDYDNRSKELKALGTYLNVLEIHIKELIDIITPLLDDEDDEEEEENNETLEDVLNELNELIGLDEVKEEIENLINLIKIKKIREERGLPTIPMTYHLCFTGNPGTGKTTVARLIAKIYYHLGILSKGHLVEVERADLVGAYIGTTAIKTKEVIDKAMGGILFIDEAYSLTNNKAQGDYGLEAIEALIKSMEDNRNDLIIIFAGYTKEMNEFIKANPGLKSRVKKYIDFPDYDHDELYAIFNMMAYKNGFILDNKAKDIVYKHFELVEVSKTTNFANARDVRNYFEAAITKQANRLANISDLSNEDLQTLTSEDF